MDNVLIYFSIVLSLDILRCLLFILSTYLLVIVCGFKPNYVLSLQYISLHSNLNIVIWLKYLI